MTPSLRRSPRLMASTNTSKEHPKVNIMDVFLFEVSKNQRGEPKISKTASVLHNIATDITLGDLKCLLRQNETSSSAIFVPSAGLYYVRKGCKQMVDLKTENDLISCKEEYKDMKDKKLSHIRIACATVDINGTAIGL